MNIFFDEDMDQTVTPLPADLEIEVDSTGKVPDTVQWTDARTLFFEYNEAVLNPVIVRIILDSMVADFRALTLFRVAPFNLLTAEES